MTEPELRELLDIADGDHYDFFAARDAVEDIERALVDRGYIQSRVRLRRKGDERSVALDLTITAGPRVELVFSGASVPRKVVEEVREQWRRGVFDTQRIDDSVDALSGWLVHDRFLQPTVTARIDETAPDQRRVSFNIAPGTRYETIRLAFDGASGISPDVLDDIIEEQDLEQQLFTDPVQVTDLLQRYYREQGYLAAEIDEPAYEYAGSTARVVLRVTEGARFTVRDITARGNTVIATPTLLGQVPFAPGDPFLPFAAENALEAIRRVYWSRGYNDARPDYELVVDRPAGRADVRFTLNEGVQSVIAGITVEGHAETSERLVREQVELKPDAPLDLGALARSRRNLYDTGAFSIADITREDLESQVPGQKRVQLNVSVREVQPLQLRYGVSFDTERGVGGIADVSTHNRLGKARVVGVRSRYDAQLREVRGSISQPSLRYWPIQTTGSVYWREETNPETASSGRFDISRRGASILQERELANAYVWSYGFRYERAHSFDPAPGGVLDELVTVTPLTSSFTREARDEVLDATRGSFSSHAFAYSPSWLGSDQAFIKYFGQ